MSASAASRVALQPNQTRHGVRTVNAGQNLEALLVVGSTDDLNHEIEVGGQAMSGSRTRCRRTDALLRPPLVEAVENGLCAGAVDVGQH